MALTVKDAEEHQIVIARNVAATEMESTTAEEEEEEEEEFFEINLEAVNEIPPPHYWESYVTATSNTLMANCLLPIVDVSSAIPTAAKACNALTWPTTSVLVVESVAPPEFKTGFHSFGVFASQYKKTKA